MNAQTNKARSWLVLLCTCAGCTAGCFTKSTPTKPPINIIASTHPILPASTTETAMEEPPEMKFEGAEAPVALVTGSSAPAKPRVTATPASEPAPAEKVAGPTIAPEVPSQELTEAKAETEQNLAIVEKNLTLAWGRKLNASQQDLMSKVRGFSDSAKEAMRSGDWVRAKNLSKKAEVLSEELAGTL